jgi:hypothetical protein
VTLPLLSLSDDPVLREATRAVIRQTHADTLADRAASPAGQLLQVLIEIAAKDERKTTALSDLTSAFIERFGGDFERPITNRYVGSLLRRSVGIRPYKSHGTFQVPLDRERIATRAVQYGIEAN